MCWLLNRLCQLQESKQTRTLNVDHSIPWELPTQGGGRGGSNQPKCQEKIGTLDISGMSAKDCYSLLEKCLIITEIT